MDVTSSVDRVSFQTTIKQVSAMLPLALDAFRCAIIRVVPFAGTLFVSIAEVPIPALPNPESACRAASTATKTAIESAVSQLYPKVASAQRDRTFKTYLAQQQPAADRARDTRRAAVAQAADRLQAAGALDPRGPCTALPQAIQRALQRSQHVLVISDGVPTCTPPRKVRKPKPSDNLWPI